MSASGTKRTSQSRSVMSAFGGKADVTVTQRNVCFRPDSDVGAFQHFLFTVLKAYHACRPGVVALDRDHAWGERKSVALRFGGRILDLCNGFFRPIEIDSRGKTLLKQRQHIFKDGNHLRIDFPQLGILFCHLPRVGCQLSKVVFEIGIIISKPFFG